MRVVRKIKSSYFKLAKVIVDIILDLKCRLMSFSDCNEENLRINQQLCGLLYNLIKDVNLFNKKNKRRGKKRRR